MTSLKYIQTFFKEKFEEHIAISVIEPAVLNSKENEYARSKKEQNICFG
jgi:hypothetical protein